MKKGTQVSEKIPAANRQYKDTVFRMLFSEKENLLSLYNAVTGKAYQNADDLKIVTLENAIYMDPSEMVRDLWTGLGIAPDRILLEQNSRNTAENASFTRDLVTPGTGETWVLVTSAFHMPRAYQTFERQGWTGLVAWPVDFRSGDLADGRGIWRLDRNLFGVNLALKEYLGTLVYGITGR